MAQPSVGIVIPCFNQKRFLRTAIESALRQTIAPEEVIVVDDGSSKMLSDVTSSYGMVLLLRQENRGLASARNTGAKAATTDMVIFLDADDVLHANAIAAGLECFRENTNAGFVYGGFRIVSRMSTETEYRPVDTHTDLVRTNWIGMVATVMFDRRKLLDCGGFDESLEMCEDWDAYLRLSRKFPFASHPHIIADYVRHDSNASNNVSELRKWIEVVRQKEFERGLDADDEKAWLEGKAVWLMRVPDPVPRSAAERAARKVARVLLRPFRT